MEDSAFEAIYTGVYIFIFVAALTTTLYLFNSINDVAEKSYEYGKQVEGKTLIEAPTDSNNYITDDEVISYYFNYVKKDTFSNKNDFEKDVEVKFSDSSLNNISLNYSQVYSRVKGKIFYIKTDRHW